MRVSWAAKRMGRWPGSFHPVMMECHRRSKHEKHHGTFVQVRCCFVLDMESDSLGSEFYLGQSHPDGCIMVESAQQVEMVALWWRSKKRRRPASQSLPLRVELTKSGEIDLQKWREKKHNKQGCTNLVNDVYQSSKTGDFTKQLFFPKTPNWGQGASLIRFEFPRSQFRFPGLVIPQELH